MNKMSKSWFMICAGLLIVIVATIYFAVIYVFFVNRYSGNATKEHVSATSNSSALFLIGDSSVDCGGNSNIVQNPLSLHPCTNDSFSALIPGILAKRMNVSILHYKRNLSDDALKNGVNYGSAQSTILHNPNNPFIPSMKQQLSNALESIKHMKSNGSLESSVFYVALGMNDYMNLLIENSSVSSGSSRNADILPRQLVNQLSKAFKQLYEVGVRKIIGVGIHPLGCAPRVIVKQYQLSGGDRRRLWNCVSEINQLILKHNQLLYDSIVDLNFRFTDAHFVFCDVYQGVMQILENPQVYGITDVRSSCCGRGWHGAGLGCQSLEMACNNSSSHMWWDFYNPSDAVNSILADTAWFSQPLEEICYPVNIKSLISG